MADKKTVTDTGLAANEDEVIVAPDTVEQETEVKIVKKKPKGRLFLLGGTAAIGAILLYGALSGGDPLETTSVATPPRMNATSGGQTLLTNPQYAEELRLANDARAEEARRTGQTFIPTSENVLRRDDTTSEAIPDAVAPIIDAGPDQEPVEIRKIAPPPTMPQLRREGVTATAAQPQAAGTVQASGGGNQQPEENPYLANMGQYFTSIASARSPVSSETESLSSRSPAGGSAAGAAAPQAGTQVAADGTVYQQPVYASSAETIPAAAQQSGEVVPVPLSPAQRRAGMAQIGAMNANYRAHEDGLVRDQTGAVVGIVNQDGSVSDNNGGLIGTVNPDGSVSMVASAQESSLLNVADAEEQETVYIPAGDIVYAEVITNNSSDRPEVPVIAKVTVGKYEGARILGTFSTDDASGKLVISFSQMTFEDKTVPIKALAVDGFNGDSAVRSSIDRRYLRRYGPIFASTFLTGLAKGLAETEQTVVGIGDAQSIVDAKKTTEESVWSGISDATGAVTSDISSRAPSGPNIKLGSGYPIGILFVDDLRENPEEEEL